MEDTENSHLDNMAMECICNRDGKYIYDPKCPQHPDESKIANLMHRLENEQMQSENARLKSELDKAITYLSKTYRYLNADSVFREEIKDFLKDKR